MQRLESQKITEPKFSKAIKILISELGIHYNPSSYAAPIHFSDLGLGKIESLASLKSLKSPQSNGTYKKTEIPK